MPGCPQCQFECDATHRFCPACGFPVGQLVEDADDPIVGATLPGGYVVLELIGVGGMGRVYRAEQTALGRTVAVKIIHSHLVGEENAAARFITEARAASRLNHPNSVGIIDFGRTEDGQLYLVMEYLRGHDLARIAYEEGPLPFRRIVDVLKQVLAALSEAHELGIIHRDLKPENVVVEPKRGGGDFVKVVDFGLAKMLQGRPGAAITSPGIVCGTPEYMSPEQGRGEQLDARSDVYAVGVVFYQLLTGRLPFEAESPTQVVLMHLSLAPPDPNQVAPERRIPAALVDVLNRALAKDAGDRYPDADSFRLALGEAMDRVEGRSNGEDSGALRCASCGSFNAVGQKFCGECGSSLKPAARVSVDETPTPPDIKPAKDLDREDVPEPIAPKRRASVPFVGRDDALMWLEACRARAHVGTCAIAIVGEHGVGKSRLLREFGLVCAAAGDVVVSIGPDPTWTEVGYHGVRSSIMQLADLPADGGDPSKWPAASAEARHALTEIFSGEAIKGVSASQRRFGVAAALRWAVRRASERMKNHRVVLLVDDVGRIDGASRNAMLDAIAEPSEDASVLFVFSHTPELDYSTQAVAIERHVLSGLTAQQANRIVAEASPVPMPPWREGHGPLAPLYVDQAMRFAAEQGSSPPSRLVDLVALRVERLAPSERRVLQAVAILGDQASELVVRALLDDATDLGEGLAALQEAGMLEVDATCATIRCSHPLIREVVLATIPVAVRRELYKQAAQSVENAGAPIEVRAFYELQAGNSFTALVMLDRVSQQCEARGDSEGAVLSLRRALELARIELVRGELDDPMRAVLLFSRKLGEALVGAGKYLDADGVLREALDMAGPTGVERGFVLAALARVAIARGRVGDGQSFWREANEIAAQNKADGLRKSLDDLKRSFA